MGWQTLSALDEVFGAGGTLGRDTKSQAVLLPRLRAALERLNPSFAPESISAAIDELIRDRGAMSLSAANRELYSLLKDGIEVTVPHSATGGQEPKRVRVIDWDNPSANDFLLVSQLSITGTLYTRRPDLVGFVNGLPIVVIEFKKPGVPAQQAFEDNLICYKADIPQLFWSNGMLIASNGTESRVGSLTADWERFFEWKRIEREDEPRRVSLEVMLRGTCEPGRLLDLLEGFSVFSEHKAGLVKILGQNHQYLGVNNAISAMLEARKQGHGRGGVFWQTQGSGKSLAMVFFAQKILRKIPGNWTFIIVSDRVELDDQIAKTFKTCGAVSETESDQCHAETGAHLRQLLAENHRYVFTLIHKFQAPKVLCDRADVIVLTDEAHRSQYDQLALNMRAALPNAIFLAFTGTPLIAGEERTREVFGDYVSIYDFQQSVEDKATVPLFYENRTPQLRLENPNLNDDIYNLIEAAGLDDEQEKKLARELGRTYQLLTRDDRLDAIAVDIVQHFLGRGFQGKAMVVSIDKATALRMYNKVRASWNAEAQRVEQEVARLTEYEAESANPDHIRELRAQLDVMRRTDMALIVSPGQNEIEQMHKLGLDIAPHRKRMNEETLAEKFKDSTDPLRLVFLCAMWLTGFDVPSCSTVYLDKPMRNHTLMQTIARANRVFPGKHSGLIVDYANVFASLEKALAIYAKGRAGERPIRDKQQLVDALRQSVAEIQAFSASHGIRLEEIDACPAATLQRLTKIAAAVEALISPDPVRKELLGQARWVQTLFQAVKPDPSVLEFSSCVACLSTIAASIKDRTGEGPADISSVMADLNKVLDDSVAADGFHIAADKAGQLDLTTIDFEALGKRFESSQNKNIDLEQLKAAIRSRLARLIRLNRTRTDYQAKFEELIESYNTGSRNIEEVFKELLVLSRNLNAEQERHVREKLSEEELVVFDILTRPAPELSAEERNEVKKVAKELLAKLKDLLVLNWRQKATARSQVKLAIEDLLDQGLPRVYTPQLYKDKCHAMFEHVYETYRDRGGSAYSTM
jgi:type I restriction enzyme R subunit